MMPVTIGCSTRIGAEPGAGGKHGERKQSRETGAGLSRARRGMAGCRGKTCVFPCHPECAPLVAGSFDDAAPHSQVLSARSDPHNAGWSALPDHSSMTIGELEESSAARRAGTGPLMLAMEN